MNERGHEVLIGAAMRGEKQAKCLQDVRGGMCARGVLSLALFGTPDWTLPEVTAMTGRWKSLHEAYALSYDPQQCPMGCDRRLSEFDMLRHLNDDHDADFLTISRKIADVFPATKGSAS